MPKHKVLIVDDSKAMRLIVRRTLRQAGFEDIEVSEAANGLEALSALEKAPADLVLSDWNMPEMSGLELLNQLNARKIAVPFGFITTEGTPEMRATAQAAGALFLVAKPFTPEDVRLALKVHLP
jgi:two-component system, chemotaxis family, chemotaxis protein CheY